jgi:hypothetical protein
LASGCGWRVEDVVCNFGPAIAYPGGGMIRLASRLSREILQVALDARIAVFAPGALLLGNERDCFECSQSHASAP